MEKITVQLWLKEGNNHQMGHTPAIYHLEGVHRVPCVGEFLEVPSRGGDVEKLVHYRVVAVSHAPTQPRLLVEAVPREKDGTRDLQGAEWPFD